MASGPLVYTRKTHNKTPKPTPNPQPPHQTPADDATSSHPPPPIPSTSTPSDDASKNNTNRHHHQSNGQHRSVTINIASHAKDEVRELRRKLNAELEQVRTLSKKLEARELRLSATAAGGGYTQSQHSVSDNNTQATTAPIRRQLSVSVPPDNNSSLIENFEKEKRTPKANQYYRNSDFVLIGKEKFPPPELNSHKKFKPIGTQLVEKKYAQAFKSCSTLLSKLMKHKHGWVFNTPVDVKGLGLHDYYSIIKHPMDLGTVKSRLNKNWYKSPGEFAEDVRLTFRNAMTYNPKGQDVHLMAEQLSQMFEEWWPAIEAEYTYLSSYLPPVTTKKALLIDVRTLERSDSTIHPVAVESKPRPVNYTTTHIGRPPALKKPKAKDLHKRDMTLEEKQRLSNNLQNLPSEKLDSVVQIIKKRNSSLCQHDDEIEVDIDSVDVETLWELDRFVTNYKKSLSKNKKKAELASLAKAEADLERRQERIPEPGAGEGPKESKTVLDEKKVTSSSPVGGENRRENASRSSSSSSSSSDSGSSSSDSDSESSSGYGSDAAHSPRT